MFEDMMRAGAGEGREVHVADLTREAHYSVTELGALQERFEQRFIQVGSGSSHCLLREDGSMDTDPRLTAFLEHLLMGLIEFINGKPTDFLGICFSAQSLSMAYTALANLVERDISPHDIHTFEELRHVLGEHGPSAIWEANHPMAFAAHPEFGVLASDLHAANDPLFRGIEMPEGPPRIRLHHVNKQVIRRAPIDRAEELLRGLLRLTVLMTRNIPLRESELGQQQIVTGFRLARFVPPKEEPEPSSRGFVGIQAHPEWERERFAERLTALLLNDPAVGVGYLGMDEKTIAAKVEEIRTSDSQGTPVFRNFFNEAA